MSGLVWSVLKTLWKAAPPGPHHAGEQGPQLEASLGPGNKSPTGEAGGTEGECLPSELCGTLTRGGARAMGAPRRGAKACEGPTSAPACTCTVLFLRTSVAQHLIKAQVPIQWVWAGAREAALLTSSGVAAVAHRQVSMTGPGPCLSSVRLTRLPLIHPRAHRRKHPPLPVPPSVHCPTPLTLPRPHSPLTAPQSCQAHPCLRAFADAALAAWKALFPAIRPHPPPSSSKRSLPAALHTPLQSLWQLSAGIQQVLKKQLSSGWVNLASKNRDDSGSSGRTRLAADCSGLASSLQEAAQTAQHCSPEGWGALRAPGGPRAMPGPGRQRKGLGVPWALHEGR